MHTYGRVHEAESGGVFRCLTGAQQSHKVLLHLLLPHEILHTVMLPVPVCTLKFDSQEPASDEVAKTKGLSPAGKAPTIPGEGGGGGAREGG